MKNRIATFAVAGLVTLLGAACAKKHEASTERPPVVQGVQTVKVEAGAVEDFYEATGTVRSKTTTVLSSKVMGSVTALRAGEGDRVRAGQVVVEIDNREAAAQLQKAQAGLREAQEAAAEVEQAISAAESAKAAAEAGRKLAASTFARYQTLLERKSVSPQEFDEVKAKQQIAEAEAERADRMLQTLVAKRKQVQARADQARADIAGAQVHVGYARVVAPISGVVVSKQIEVGATATPGAPLLTIEDDSRYRLEAAVDESQIGRVRLHQRATVRVDALGGEELSGTVAEIVPAADPASRSYAVRIDLPVRQGLRSGLYGAARFTTGERRAITVPSKAVVERGQLVGVFVVDANGVARLRLVKTGKSVGDRVEILSGLSDGERVVVGGVEKVGDGNRVQ
jgi:membrane fusion protein, multidrug efflux system